MKIGRHYPPTHHFTRQHIQILALMLTVEGDLGVKLIPLPRECSFSLNCCRPQGFFFLLKTAKKASFTLC